MKTTPTSLLHSAPVIPTLCVLVSLLTTIRVEAQSSTDDPRTPTNAQTAPPSNDNVVKLETFKVSDTSLGRYAEAESSTASKIPTPLKELAQTLQVLNIHAIQDRDPQTLIDMYASVVGMVQVTRSVTGFSLRGFDTTTAGLENVQYDGLPGPVATFGAVQMANIDSIEVLKGPNSILYGKLKVGGSVNILTKSPNEVEQGVLSGSFVTGAGTYGKFMDSNSYIGSLDITGPIDAKKHWLYRLIAQNEDLFRFRKGDFDRDFAVYPSLTYRWSPETSFTVKLEYSQERQRSDDGLSAPFGSVSLVAPYDTVYQYPSDWRSDKGESLSTRFKTVLPGDWTLTFSTRTMYRRTGENARGESVPFLPVTTVTPIMEPRRYRSETDGNRWNSFDVNAYKTIGSGNFQQALMIGASGDHNFLGAYRIVQTYPFPTGAVALYNPDLTIPPPVDTGKGLSDARSVQQSLGVYGMDQIKLWNRLHIIVGVRSQQTKGHNIDPAQTVPFYTSQKFGSTVWQYGGIYDVTEQLSGYVNWSESFYPPALNAIDANNNNSFPPETGKQWEVGLKFETRDLKLRTYLAAYDIKKSNVLINTAVTNSLGLAISRLDGGQTSRGIELENEWFPVPYFEIQAGGAYNKAYISASSNPAILNTDLAAAPRWSGNLWARYNVPKGTFQGVGLSLGVIYVGKRFGGDPARGPAGYPVVPGYVRFDTGLYYKWRAYTLSLEAKNVFDRKYIQSVATFESTYPGYPRNLTLKIDYHF